MNFSQKALNKFLLRPIRQTYSYCRWDIHQGFYGLYKWGAFAWRWRPWDYAHGLQALQIHLRALEPCLRDGYHVNGARDADQVKEALILLDRILSDERYNFDHGADCLSEKQNFKTVMDSNTRDMKRLGLILGKHMLKWWD